MNISRFTSRIRIGGEITAYKYLRAEHARMLLDEGRIRIGTLHKYRSEEELGLEQGDRQEGWYERFEHVGEAEYFPEAIPHHRNQLLDRGILANNNSIQLLNVNFSSATPTPNAYVYCTSSRRDRSLLRAFQADVCIEIRSLNAFVKALLPAMWPCSEGHTIHPCFYTDRRRTSFDAETPWQCAFMKAPEYSHQAEVRVVWYPLGKIVAPHLDVELPELRRLVRIASC